MTEKQKVLILGGGFGGIKAALELAKTGAFSVSLLSDQTNFRYYPQLYHAATGGSSLAASIPLSDIFKNKSVELIDDSASKVDRQTKRVECKSTKSYEYDILIIALGVVTNYFGIKGLEEHAYGIKSLDEAKRFKKHLHDLIVEQHKPDINYVVIGGGPTGVELAGALPAYIKKIMNNHHVVGEVHVDLVEAEPRLISRMSVSYSSAIEKRLKKLGVKLFLGQSVEAETANGIMVSGHSIDSHSVVWTAGVTNNPFFKDNGFNLGGHGKVIVDEFLSTEPDIYVIGDNADTKYSGMAQTALYDGRFIAEHLNRLANNKQPVAYPPKEPIYVTPVGHGWAAVKWGSVEFRGRLGWWLRSVADFIGYHDLEPWWPAGHHWMAASSSEEDCPNCRNK